MTDTRTKPTAGKVNLETLFLVGLIGGWFLLQIVVFPKLGIST